MSCPQARDCLVLRSYYDSSFSWFCRLFNARVLIINKLFNPFQITIRRNGNEQFVLD